MGIHSRVSSVCRGVESCKSLACSRYWENVTVTTSRLEEGVGWGRTVARMGPRGGDQAVGILLVRWGLRLDLLLALSFGTPACLRSSCPPSKPVSKPLTYRVFFTAPQCLGFTGGASGKELACRCRGQNRHRFDPWVWKIPWRRAGQPIPVFLPRESHGQRRIPWAEENPMDRGVHGVTKSWTQLSTHPLRFLYPDSSSWLQLLSLLRSEASSGGFI